MMQLELVLGLELERNKMKLVLTRNEQMLELERSELRLEQHIELELGLELERNELKLVVQIELELELGHRSLAYSLLELKRVGIVVVVLVGKLVVVVEVGSKLELAEDNILELVQQRLGQRMMERMKGMLVQLERMQGMLALVQRIVAKLLALNMAMLVLVLNEHSCVV